jgi:hypothetical protein
LLQQFAVRATLQHHAAIQHDDLIGIDNGGEPVGNDQRGAVGRDDSQLMLDGLFGTESSALVASSKMRMADFQNGTRNGHPLFFHRRTVSGHARPPVS